MMISQSKAHEKANIIIRIMMHTGGGYSHQNNNDINCRNKTGD